MKRKLMQSILSVLILSVVVLTVFFVKIINNQYNQNISHDLLKNNEFIISILETKNNLDKEAFFKDNLSKLETRVTYIDKAGNVLLDSIADSETMDNHNNRSEVKEAREKGVGYSLRYSSSVGKNMLYVATLFDDGYIIRSSMPVDYINSFENRYIKYYSSSYFFKTVPGHIKTNKGPSTSYFKNCKWRTP